MNTYREIQREKEIQRMRGREKEREREREREERGIRERKNERKKVNIKENEIFNGIIIAQTRQGRLRRSNRTPCRLEAVGQSAEFAGQDVKAANWPVPQTLSNEAYSTHTFTSRPLKNVQFASRHSRQKSRLIYLDFR